MGRYVMFALTIHQIVTMSKIYAASHYMIHLQLYHDLPTSIATIVDSLDTLLLMGLPEEFELARAHVAGIDWHETRGNDLVDAFETNIRYIGGLLGAYDLSDDRLFLDKAVELADLLLPIFDSPTGIPYQFVDFPR